MYRPQQYRHQQPAAAERQQRQQSTALLRNDRNIAMPTCLFVYVCEYARCQAIRAECKKPLHYSLTASLNNEQNVRGSLGFFLLHSLFFLPAFAFEWKAFVWHSSQD